VRHYVRLSQKNHAIDLALYPLGSCTMKHNPRLNEKMARLPGFADIHPLQPQSTVQGALELMDRAGPLAEDPDRHARRGPVAPRPAPMASCAACWPSAPLMRRPARRPSRRVLVPTSRPRHQPGHGGLLRLSPWMEIPARRR
jgi:hypothetical protein